MRIVHSPLHRLHEPPFEVARGLPGPAFEVGARAESIRAALAADPAFALEEPSEHGLAPALAVHDPGLVRYLETAWDDARRSGLGAPALVPDTFPWSGSGSAPAGSDARWPVEPTSPVGRAGRWCIDTTTPIVEGTWAAARASLDVALTAADAALAGERAVYGLCRPPGHHAGRSTYGGYCYLNNAAIAVEHLVGRGAGRVGVLDVDYHHGNGTQALFWERGDVPYASLHGDPRRAYPYYWGHAAETGAGRGAGATMNQPLPAGTGDEAYLAALDRALDWLAGRHDGLLVVSLGIDTYRLDPISDLELSTSAYHEVGRRVAASGARLVVLQEGGYHVPHLGANVREWLRGAAGLPPGPPPPAAGPARSAV